MPRTFRTPDGTPFQLPDFDENNGIFFLVDPDPNYREPTTFASGTIVGMARENGGRRLVIQLEEDNGMWFCPRNVNEYVTDDPAVIRSALCWHVGEACTIEFRKHALPTTTNIEDSSVVTERYPMVRAPMSYRAP